MESYSSLVSIALSSYLHSLKDQPPWWYGVDLDTEHEWSFCKLLGIDPDEYQEFLMLLNFKTQTKDSTNRKWKTSHVHQTMSLNSPGKDGIENSDSSFVLAPNVMLLTLTHQKNS